MHRANGAVTTSTTLLLTSYDSDNQLKKEKCLQMKEVLKILSGHISNKN